MAESAAYALEAKVAVAILVISISDYVGQIMDERRPTLPDIWDAGGLWPFHVAVFFFSFQVVFCSKIAMMLSGVSRVCNIRQREMLCVAQVQHILIALVCSGFISGIYYALVLWQKSWLVLRGRCLLWSISAPCQLHVSAKLHSTADETACYRAAIPAHICMALGQIGFSVIGERAGDSPFGLRHMCYIVGVLCVLTSFKRLFALPPEPTMKPSRQTVFPVTVALWITYPFCNFARWLGLISPWQEQVLLWTGLDVASKTLLLLSMFSEPFCTFIISSSGNLQFLLATTDGSTVVDSQWVLVRDFLTYQAGTDFLNRIVNDDEQRRALVLASQTADKQELIVAQKVILTFQLEGGGTLKTECLVSRCHFGRRHLSFVQLEECPPAALDTTDTIIDPDQLGIGASSLGSERSARTSRAPLSEFSMAHRQLIVTWCTAARIWGRRYLAPAANPSQDLIEAVSFFINNVFRQWDPQQQIQWDSLSLEHQWDELWGIMTDNEREEEERQLFVTTVLALGDCLWPWLGRSVMIYAPDPFIDFRSNGSHSSWIETRSTCDRTSR